MTKKMKRRDFMRTGAVAGLTLAATKDEVAGFPMILKQSTVKPLVISSANGNRFKNGGDRTCILCGFLGSETLNDPVIAMLPKVLKLNVAEGASGQWIESSFRFAAQELSQGRPQPPPVLARLA